MLFACDQKIEHLNDDFFGANIALDDAEPEHMFQIGSQQRSERAFRRANGLLALRQLTRRAEPGEAAREDLW